jgi:hypothetical protein
VGPCDSDTNFYGGQGQFAVADISARTPSAGLCDTSAGYFLLLISARHLGMKALSVRLDLRLRVGVNHVLVVGGDFLVQPAGGMSKGFDVYARRCNAETECRSRA